MMKKVGQGGAGTDSGDKVAEVRFHAVRELRQRLY